MFVPSVRGDLGTQVTWKDTREVTERWNFCSAVFKTQCSVLTEHCSVLSAVCLEKCVFPSLQCSVCREWRYSKLGLNWRWKLIEEKLRAEHQFWDYGSNWQKSCKVQPHISEVIWYDSPLPWMGEGVQKKLRFKERRAIKKCVSNRTARDISGHRLAGPQV